LVERAKAIERVAGESSQQMTVNVLGEIQNALSIVEKDRVAIKAPFLALGKKIDAAAQEYCGVLEIEKARLKRLLGEFQAAIQRKADEERRVQMAELARLQKEREEAEAKNDQAAVVAVEMKAVEVLTAPAQAIVPKAEGMAVKYKWAVKVNNIDALYKLMPDLVKLEPRLREINARIAQMAAADPNTPPGLPGCEVTREIDVQSR
jgi:chemotaxis protein histidine kinase CheA